MMRRVWLWVRITKCLRLMKDFTVIAVLIVLAKIC